MGRNIPTSSTSNKSDFLILKGGGRSLLSLQEFQHDSVKDWMEASWVSLCSWATAVYLVFVFGVRAFMTDR